MHEYEWWLELRDRGHLWRDLPKSRARFWSRRRDKAFLLQAQFEFSPGEGAPDELVLYLGPYELGRQPLRDPVHKHATTMTVDYPLYFSPISSQEN